MSLRHIVDGGSGPGIVVGVGHRRCPPLGNNWNARLALSLMLFVPSRGGGSQTVAHDW